MTHNIEGDIRNCIEVAKGDYNLSHLDEPMLKYYNELVAKAKVFDEVKTFVSKKLDEDVRHYHCFKSERDNGELVAYERIDDIIREHMERADDER